MGFSQRYSNVQLSLITDVEFNRPIKFHRLHFVSHQRSSRNSKTPQRIHEGYVTLNEFTGVIVRAGVVFSILYLSILLFFTTLAQLFIFSFALLDTGS